MLMKKQFRYGFGLLLTALMLSSSTAWADVHRADDSVAQDASHVATRVVKDVKHGAKVAAKGVERGAHAVSKGVHRGVEATGNAAKTVEHKLNN